MRKLLSLFFISALVGCKTADSNPTVTPAIEPDAELEARVSEIVSSMSLDDKIGQMCQVTVGVIQAAGSEPDGTPRIDPAKLDTVINMYRVGSILNVPGDFAQSPEVWRHFIGTIQEASMSAIGIPDLYGVDQNHGVTYTRGGTLFPQEINMAASFNRALVRRGAEVCAYESRATSIPWVFNPVMDLLRNPVWPRMWESFGEDPFVNGAMAVEMVRGYQGDDPNHVGPYNVAACLKHYMGYGNPTSGQDRTPAVISLPDLREKYFYPYSRAICAGALSVMVNSGIVNGMPFHASREFLTDWLKKGLNWDGVIVTDWADIHNIWKRDRVAADYKEAIMLAVNAGIDMSMTPYDCEFCTLLKELVDEGKVEMSRIDDAVSRVVRLKLRLGLFENPVTEFADYPLFGSRQHADEAFEMAVQSEVLLKNENGILPLAKGTRILVTGPNANSMRTLNGGWSYTWQGSENPWFHEQYNTIYEALRNVFGSVELEQGMDYVEDYGRWQSETNLRIEKAVAAARRADVIVACVGENSYTESPGNINDLRLWDNQTRLVRELAKTGKPIVLVLNEGRPRIIREIEPLAAAVVDVMLPGNYGGDALAALLSGERNFSAKLPFTYPKWNNALVTYDHKPSESIPAMEGVYNYSADIDVQWPFGFGLSYTTFEYSNLTVDRGEFTPDDTLTITVDVKNTGKRDGMEAVILYSSDLVASLTPDVLRVRGFDKVTLKPGETKTVTFVLPASELAFVNTEMRYVVEEGDFEFTAGGRKVTARCTSTGYPDNK